jgi:hypothetical protein
MENPDFVYYIDVVKLQLLEELQDCVRLQFVPRECPGDGVQVCWQEFTFQLSVIAKS